MYIVCFIFRQRRSFNFCFGKCSNWGKVENTLFSDFDQKRMFSTSKIAAESSSLGQIDTSILVTRIIRRPTVLQYRSSAPDGTKSKRGKLCSDDVIIKEDYTTTYHSSSWIRSLCAFNFLIALIW